MNMNAEKLDRANESHVLCPSVPAVHICRTAVRIGVRATARDNAAKVMLVVSLKVNTNVKRSAKSFYHLGEPSQCILQTTKCAKASCHVSQCQSSGKLFSLSECLKKCPLFVQAIVKAVIFSQQNPFIVEWYTM